MSVFSLVELVALNKLFQRVPPGVAAIFIWLPGDKPKGGNLLPPGVNKGGVIPGNFRGIGRLDIGMCKLCLLDELALAPSLLESSNSTLLSLVANDLSNGLGSNSNDVLD